MVGVEMSHGFVAMSVLVPILIHSIRHCDLWGGSRVPRVA
jgi:hypothetical protein